MRRKVFAFAFVVLLLVPNNLAFAKGGGVPDPSGIPPLGDVVPRGVWLRAPYYTHERIGALLRSGNDLPEPLFSALEQHLRLTYAPVRVDVHSWQSHQMSLGEDLSCFARRGQVPWQALAQANHILNPNVLGVGQTISVPQTISTTTATALKGGTPLAVALQNNIPFWEVKRLNRELAYPQEEVLVPGDGAGCCLPYPLTELTVTPQPIIRGQTSVLVLEAAAPITCEVTYLGMTSPCYQDGDRDAYALVGVSPVADPGIYDMQVRLFHAGGETVFDLPVEVDGLRYGRQWINPPGRIRDLLDPDIYFGELASLDSFREIHTPKRYWDLPLRSPLDRVSVSAGFGDWRSYGGVFETYHSGFDMRGWRGMPVYAPAAGVVVMTDTLRVRGNAILLDHGWGLITGYWHLSRIDVQEGQFVKQGDVIGLVGNTGLSTGSHLHWEMWVNGISVNGFQWVEPDVFSQVAFAPLVQEPEVEAVAEGSPPKMIEVLH